jgi:UDP-glucose:(heptosyl)LPS alpha-1,3-glucosyltransferase
MRHVVFLKSRANFRGGLEKYTHLLIRAFAAQGCRTTLLTTGNVPSFGDTQVVSLVPDTKFTLHQLMRFDNLCKQWLGQNPYEIVFGMERTTCQTHYRAGNGVHAVYLRRRALVEPLLKRLTLRINPLHRKLLAMEKQAFEASDLKILFTNSHMVRQEILNSYSVSAQKIEVVHNGVEWQAWKLPFERSLEQVREEPYQLLFVGNGYQRKGLLFLLKGLEKLKHKDFMLTVIGKDKNPSYFATMAAKLGLKEKVCFLGPQTTMVEHYQAADALVIPSIYDPFANVTVEALAMGLYVVSSPYNGGKEVLTPFSGTVIGELTSPESMAVSLLKAFENKKTEERAIKIRNSIKELDFSNQLDKIVRKTLYFF